MKISIITVTYNSAITVRDTLKSVNNQTCKDVEHIIIDGLSNDNTLNIIQQFPHVIKIISEKDKGIYDAMNKGIQLATGDIIGILNSDDIFATDNIIAQVMSIFEQNKEIDALYGNISYFATEKPDIVARFWQSKSYYDGFFEAGNVPPHPALFVKKKVYDEIGMYKIHYKIAADYEFMLRMLKIHGYKSYFLDQTIVKMRLGGISTKGFDSWMLSTRELKNTWEINGLKYPISLYFRRPYIKIKQLLFR
jgi:glycosyltransferase involved in cell wall biosynthesis